MPKTDYSIRWSAIDPLHPGALEVPRRRRSGPVAAAAAQPAPAGSQASAAEGATLLRHLRGAHDPDAASALTQFKAQRIKQAISLFDARNLCAEAASAWSHVKDTCHPAQRADAFYRLVAQQHPITAALDRPAICRTLKQLRTPR